jgi:hypothetical protein
MTIINNKMEEAQISKLEEIMDHVEDFYFGDDENSGEAMFARFAEKHAHLFSDELSATDAENKLEYTTVYQEFQQLFEKKVEGNISQIFGYKYIDLIQECGLSVDNFFELIKKVWFPHKHNCFIEK